ncbi:hypothetical protein [Alteromonas gracilis]|uniref:hypothetical protein n=1 Tax=Alteromonas gracilis TaxID=1479524 RepID=UPI00321B20CA
MSISSNAYLKDLKVDYLKIDGVFVNNICEDELTLNKLAEIGIDYFQGYHVHKPS